MKLYFKDLYFKKGDLIETVEKLNPITPWYLKIFGFEYQYCIAILGKPNLCPDGIYEYPVKIKNKKLKWTLINKKKNI